MSRYLLIMGTLALNKMILNLDYVVNNAGLWHLLSINNIYNAVWTALHYLEHVLGILGALPKEHVPIWFYSLCNHDLSEEHTEGIISNSTTLISS